jgi:hypothetical protein
MTKIEVTTPSEYGIMFLYDSRAKPTIPDDAGERAVTYSATCLAFSVLVYVDGDARVVLCDNTDSPYREYFRGEIDCPNKILSLCDTNGLAFATVPLRDTTAKVSLRMSEETNPDVVECLVENMGCF